MIVYPINLDEGKYILKETRTVDGFYKLDQEWEIDVVKTGDGTAENPYEYQTKYGNKVLYSSRDGIIEKLNIENEAKNNTLIVEKRFQGLETNQILELNDYSIMIVKDDIKYELHLNDPNVQKSADGLSFYWILAKK